MNNTPIDVDMSGKVVLITGATDGIGKATARALAKLGAAVVLAGRNRAKGEQVLAELRQQTGNERLDLLTADLSVQADVRALAQQFKERYDRLDVLVNNAGAVYTTYQRTADALLAQKIITKAPEGAWTSEITDAVK